MEEVTVLSASLIKGEIIFVKQLMFRVNYMKALSWLPLSQDQSVRLVQSINSVLNAYNSSEDWINHNAFRDEVRSAHTPPKAKTKNACEQEKSGKTHLNLANWYLDRLVSLISPALRSTT